VPRDYLADLADSILAAAAAALTEPMTGVPAPGKVFVSFSDPLADLDGCCGDEEMGGGQLTVHIGGPAAGDPLLFPAQQAAPCSTLTHARFTVTLMRCYPAVDDRQSDAAPTAADFGAYSRQALIDLWCLTCGLRDAVRDGALASDCKEVRIVQSRQLSPLGGCAGWQIVLDFRANDGGPGVGS
jgi:hypothetical protein